MDVTYKCKKEVEFLQVCHHNLTIDGEKNRVVDPGCRLNEKEVIDGVKSGIIVYSEGWTIDCD